MNTNTNAVPAWLNIDLIVDPELRARIPKATAAARSILAAIAESFDDLLEVQHLLDRPHVDEPDLDGWPNYLRTLTGADAIDNRLSVALSMLQHLADASYRPLALAPAVNLAHVDPDVLEVIARHQGGEA